MTSAWPMADAVNIMEIVNMQAVILVFIFSLLKIWVVFYGLKVPGGILPLFFVKVKDFEKEYRR